MTSFLWRTIKWRFHNRITIIITILQPMIWLVLYSAIAGQSMKNLGISNYTAFILPGLVVLVSFSCCSSSGIINYLTKMDGSFYRILIAPVKRSSIIIGQLLEAVLCTFLEVGIMFAAGLLFSVNIASGCAGMLIIIFLVFLSAFFMAGLAYAMSLTLPNEMVYETVMNAIVLPMFFLSTALFPAETLSGALKTAVTLNPFTHVINALRSLIIQENISPFVLCQVSFMLIIMCAASFYWAYCRLKKETSL